MYLSFDQKLELHAQLKKSLLLIFSQNHNNAIIRKELEQIGVNQEIILNEDFLADCLQEIAVLGSTLLSLFLVDQIIKFLREINKDNLPTELIYEIELCDYNRMAKLFFYYFTKNRYKQCENYDNTWIKNENEDYHYARKEFLQEYYLSYLLLKQDESNTAIIINDLTRTSHDDIIDIDLINMKHDLIIFKKFSEYLAQVEHNIESKTSILLGRIQSTMLPFTPMLEDEDTDMDKTPNQINLAHEEEEKRQLWKRNIETPIMFSIKLSRLAKELKRELDTFFETNDINQEAFQELATIFVEINKLDNQRHDFSSKKVILVTKIEMIISKLDANSKEKDLINILKKFLFKLKEL